MLRNLCFNPLISGHESVRKSNRRLPTQHLPQAAVITVAAADALRLAEIMDFGQSFASDGRDQVNQSVNCDQLIRTKVQWLAVIGGHEPPQPFYTIVHVHKRPCLLS